MTLGTKWTTIFVNDRKPNPIRMALTVDAPESGQAFTIAAQALTDAGQFPRDYEEILLFPAQEWDGVVASFRPLDVVRVWKHPY
jgi:hypothetical protein